jgi:glutaconate CoA-transferase subunit B
MARAATNYTIDELISVCIARQVTDGDILVQGIATPLVMAGYLLAKHTHAPNISFASAISSALINEPGTVGLTRIEELLVDQALMTFSFCQIACEVLPNFQPKEFFRPAQIDAAGNFGNVIFGSDYTHPRMRLPGCGGIADVTTYYQEIYLYVPRHSRAVFVESVDFVSGLGHSKARQRGAGPCYLVSNLGQFDFANGTMRLIAHHPGTTVEKIRTKTGFPLEVAPDVHETVPPTAEEVRLLRNVIDPLGVCRLETLGGAARKRAMREILMSEKLPAQQAFIST